MKTRIHINKHNIAHNKKGGNKPVITAKTYKSNIYGNQADVYCPNCGHLTLSIVYSPDKPMSCGAVVWMVTEGEVKLY